MTLPEPTELLPEPAPIAGTTTAQAENGAGWWSRRGGRGGARIYARTPTPSCRPRFSNVLPASDDVAAKPVEAPSHGALQPVTHVPGLRCYPSSRLLMTMNSCLLCLVRHFGKETQEGDVVQRILGAILDQTMCPWIPNGEHGAGKQEHAPLLFTLVRFVL